ncbi:hypothetical protein MASR1M90_01200 [Desulfovibrionales bacterium]
MSAITAEEIKILTQYIYAASGISLDASKAYLLETRFKPLLHKYACQSYMDLYTQARADRSGNMEKEIIDAISTNETLFFRDSSPFEVFKHKILPDIIDARSRALPGRPVPLRIWSAACSTGQEVYSIAITLREMLGNLSGYQISILGTDISDDAISKASYGKYNKFEIERGLPPAVLHKYFTASGDGWRIKDEIRAMAVFKKFNLMKPFAGLGMFDIVFCRNVAIYFMPQDKKMVFEKIAGVLEPDGALIIGSTESLTGITSVFEARRYMRSVFYQRVGSGSPASQTLTPLPSALPESLPRSLARNTQLLSAPPVQPQMPMPRTAPRPASLLQGASSAAPLSRPAPPRPRATSSDLPAPRPVAPMRPASEPLAPAPSPSPVFENQPAEPDVHPAQFVRPRAATSAQPAPASRRGDKSALKRLIMQKKAAQAQTAQE